MACYAHKLNQLRPVKGNSGLRPVCVATLTGFFIGNNMPKIVIICKYCQKEFKDYFSNNRQYCSRICAYKSPSRQNYITAEYRKKMSNIMKGRKLSDYVKQCVSLAHKGVPLSKEHKKKLSDAKKRNPVRYWLGKHPSHVTGKNAYNWKGGYENHLWHNRQRRIRKLNVLGNHTFEEWKSLKKQYGYCCPACGKLEPEIKLTEDHIVPLIKGGNDYIKNIQPLCKSCNSKKQCKTIKYSNLILAEARYG